MSWNPTEVHHPAECEAKNDRIAALEAQLEASKRVWGGQEREGRALIAERNRYREGLKFIRAWAKNARADGERMFAEDVERVAHKALNPEPPTRSKETP